MRANVIWIKRVILCLLLSVATSHSARAVNVYTHADAPERQFVFVENNADNNYFVTPATALDPRMTGASAWTGLKFTGSGNVYQQSLGYIDDGNNTGLYANSKFDMWLENAPFSHPLTGLRCINWYDGCNISTSLILPQVTDALGFYGVTVTPGGAKWAHGMMSPGFYQYLQQMPLSSSFSMTINQCQTAVNYDATTGARCKDQASGIWYKRKVTHRKVAHLSFINTNAISEVFISSNGIPTINEGSTTCKNQVVSGLSGIMCKMVSYDLKYADAVSNYTIHVFPSINNPALVPGTNGVTIYDVQFSLNGNSWRVTNGIASYYTFDEMKTGNAIYVFFSSNFFKKMVQSGATDQTADNLINFRFFNTMSPESGWYEFSTSNQLIIKPRDFSVSIISNDQSSHAHREGYVGKSEPPLEFGYTITTSAKSQADRVQIKVTGPTQRINAVDHCIFSANDTEVKVPFPAELRYSDRNGNLQAFYTGCNGQWFDLTNAFWKKTTWSDGTGDIGERNKTDINFVIPMNYPISQKTLNGSDWYGNVSAVGEIHVEATWQNIN